MKTTTNLTANQIAALRAARDHGCAIVSAPAQHGFRDMRPNVIAGNTFASLAKRGLLTHSANGVPVPEFFASVGGSTVYITPAGRAAL